MTEEEVNAIAQEWVDFEQIDKTVKRVFMHPHGERIMVEMTDGSIHKPWGRTEKALREALKGE